MFDDSDLYPVNKFNNEDVNQHIYTFHENRTEWHGIVKTLAMYFIIYILFVKTIYSLLELKLVVRGRCVN